MYKWLWNALGWLVLCIVLPILVVYGGLFSFSREVPDVSGLSEARALAELEKAGLRGWLNEKHSTEIPEGYAIGTAPEAGSRRWPNAWVRVDVSLGVEITEVPRLIGETYATAQMVLEKCGLKCEIVRVRSDDVASDRVISQSIREDTPVPSGTTIRLTVSAGKKNILTVPDLVNKNVSEAKKLLESLGCKYQVHMVADQTAKDTVISQSPAPGSTLSVDRTVTIKVSSGATLYLCLNGKTLSKSATIDVQGTLHLCDCAGGGVITRPTNQYPRAADIASSGTMYMYGGKI